MLDLEIEMKNDREEKHLFNYIKIILENASLKTK